MDSKDKVVVDNQRGGTNVFESPTGKGAGFDSKGNFTGFLEPRR
jgi:hypothetical protein